MNATGIETVPTSWDDDRDVAFFRITRSLFSTDVTFGAGVLLASYDEEPATESSPTAPATAATAAAPTGDHLPAHYR